MPWMCVIKRSLRSRSDSGDGKLLLDRPVRRELPVLGAGGAFGS